MSLATGVSDAAPTERPRYLALKALAALLVAIKFWSLISANLVADEAYYWMWGQHPDLSYFDHPPLNAWLLWLSSLFGHGILQLRMWSILTSIGTVLIFLNWAKRFGSAQWEPIFWRSLCIWLAAPMFGVYPTFATSDHLLLFFVLLSGHFLISYLHAVREGEAAKPGDLYLGALFLGLAALSKYNALFLGLALVGYIATDPKLRRLLRNPHLYYAAGLALLVASPVLIWNASNGFASFEFHLMDRHEAGFLDRLTSKHVIDFLVQAALMATPFLFVALVTYGFSRPQQPFERSAWGLAVWMFWLSSLTFLAVGLTQQLYPWWNFSAYVLMIPFMGRVMRKPLMFYGHVGLGILLSVFYVYSSSVAPVLNLLDRADPARERYYGWNEIAAPIREALEQYKPDFIASSKWESASVVGYVLDDPNVVSANSRPSQYHYWFDKLDREAMRGRNALIVLQANADKRVVDIQFKALRPVEDIPIIRNGRQMTSYQIYWAEGYQPSY